MSLLKNIVFGFICLALINSCQQNEGFKSGGADQVQQQEPVTTTTLPRQKFEPEPQINAQNQRPQLPPPPAPRLPPPPPILPPPILLPPPPILPPPTIPDVSRRPDPEPEPRPEPQPERRPEPRPEPQPQNFKPFDMPDGPKYESGSLRFPITPIANMEKGFQATNPGFRAILKNSSGQIIAAGPMNVEAAMNGTKTASARGNAYPRLVMNLELKYRAGSAQSGSGTLKICLAEDPNTPMDQDITCARTGCYDRDRPCGYTGRSVDYAISGDQIEIKRWGGSSGSTQGFQLGGDADSPTQAALSVYHAAKDSPFVPTAAWEEAQSPIVIDLNQNGKIDLISFHSGKVSFDVDADGKNQITGWADKSDALLAIDLNGNGKIDSGLELFGEYSKSITEEKTGKTFKNGFAALAQYDSNFDQEINVKDEIYTKLVLWQDKNQNGESEKEELLSLSSLKIQSISLFYEKADNKNFGNMHKDNDIRLIGEYTTIDGKSHKLADVWFRYAFGESVAQSK